MATEYWSDDDTAILRERWLLGWDNAKIKTLIPNRSIKAIQSKIRALGLTRTEHPRISDYNDRRRKYTIQDDQDILARYQAGETYEQIAPTYQVLPRAIEAKISRMLEQKEIVQKPIPTERNCLWCGKPFMSVVPKPINRRCNKCRELRNDNGPSFIEAYS